MGNNGVGRMMSCDKKPYTSKREAERHRHAQFKHYHQKKIRAYLCDYCHAWHLTTSSDYGRYEDGDDNY